MFDQPSVYTELFTGSEILAFIAWTLLFWFVFRYWQTRKVSLIDIYNFEAARVAHMFLDEVQRNDYLEIYTGKPAYQKKLLKTGFDDVQKVPKVAFVEFRSHPDEDSSQAHSFIVEKENQSYG